ncbi:MAG: hypothetical protein DRG78_00010 [Epsilonproteobacteria bacterium]|nr:MAG: hypothetical protein DRG78_00010 [Campylobacterota bacterium]
MKTIDKIYEIFQKTDLHYDIDWLYENQKITNITIQDNLDESYDSCLYMLNIFCLQEIKEIAYAISEDFEHNIEVSVGDYIFILEELDINMNMFGILAGKEFFTSGYYEEGDEDEVNMQVITYLITENYYKIIKSLESHYKNNQQLLESIIIDLDIYTTYQNALEDIGSLEDCFDYPEIMKLYAWADGGFCISGES